MQIILSQLTYSSLHQFVKMIISIFISMLIVRTVSVEDFGQYGVAMGYFVFLSFLIISPEGILIRDYLKLKKRSLWNLFVSAQLQFIIFRSLVIVAASTILAILTSRSFQLEYVSQLIVLYGIFQSLYISIGSIQYILKFRLLQSTISIISIFSEGIKLLFLFLLTKYLVLSMVEVLVIFITISLLESILLMTVLLKNTNLSSSGFVHNLKTIFSDFTEYTVWQSLLGQITRYLYSIDTVILSILGVSIASIGEYSIALQIASLFLIFPGLIQMQSSIFISREKDKKKLLTIVLGYVVLSIIISGSLSLIMMLFSAPIITLYLGYTTSDIQFFVTSMAFASLVLAISKPFLSLIVAKMDLKCFFLYRGIPLLIIITSVYFLFTAFYGARGMAVSNIVAYTLFTATVIHFSLKNQSLNMRQSFRELLSRANLVYRRGLSLFQKLFS